MRLTVTALVHPEPSRPAWLHRNFVVIVLSAGCLFMALLAIEQGRTIASQRDLIRSLFQDSVELNTLKSQRVQSSHRP
jgi:hypothetical protein